MKRLPKSERGLVLYVTADGREFHISQNQTNQRFTLWDKDYNKITTSNSPVKLYAEADKP